MEPTERAEPTLPIERTEFFEAMERIEFSEASDHREDVGGFIPATVAVALRIRPPQGPKRSRCRHKSVSEHVDPVELRRQLTLQLVASRQGLWRFV
jgi:hypothetical protein